MRRLEILATSGLLIYAFHLFMAPFDRGTISALFLGVVVLTVCWHLRREGYRWQMLPTYFVAFSLPPHEIALRLGNFQESYLFALAMMTLIVAGSALSTILPVFALPTPTGPHTVGTQTRHLIDRSRIDPFSDHLEGPRELMIQIWYPADQASLGELAPYREKSITTFKSAHFSLVKTHSILGAPLAGGMTYPVLLYTPSWSGIRTECTCQVEELASHGYVVVGIDHPYCSKAVAFPDGRIARRKFVGDEGYSSEAAVDSFFKTADQQVRLRSQDARFVLDALANLNASDPEGLLTGCLDLTRVGIFGFSLGGGTAAEACCLDRRFKAGLDLGGLIAGESAELGTVVPFFFAFEGIYEAFPYAMGANIAGVPPKKRREIEFSRKQFELMKKSLSRFGGYWMVIDAIRHMDFCDSPFFSPLRRNLSNPTATARLISKFVLAFFDKHLRDMKPPLLDRPPSKTARVRFEAWTIPERFLS